jgi:hypothetical protein
MVLELITIPSEHMRYYHWHAKTSSDVQTRGYYTPRCSKSCKDHFPISHGPNFE